MTARDRLDHVIFEPLQATARFAYSFQSSL